MAIFTLLVAVAAAFLWVLLSLIRYVPGVAIPELASALAGAVWTVAVGYKIIRDTSRSKKT
jgi:hypothetical membrane protein